jgi:hypothetical protein
MENVAEREQIPQDWLLASALTTKGLVLALEAALKNSEGRYGIHSDCINISNHSCSLTIERLLLQCISGLLLYQRQAGKDAQASS